MRASLITIAFAFLAAACTSTPGPKRVGATDPTVTYRYHGDPYGPELDAVTDQAFDYCQQHFALPARLRNVEQKDDENYALFECR